MLQALAKRFWSSIWHSDQPLSSAQAQSAKNAIGLLRNRGWMTEAREFAVALGLPPDSLNEGSNPTPSDKVVGVFYDTIISTLHFRELTNSSDRRVAVKGGLRIVDVEIFSQCNRRCHYCSNAVLDRLTTNTFMDPAIYRRILSDLAEVDWDGQFRFIGLNEPTMHRAFLIQRIIEARAALPAAALTVFTNGDYLSRDYLDEIYEAGARVMYVSVHLQRGAPFDDEKILRRIGMLTRRLGLNFELEMHVPGRSVVGRIPYRDMMLQVFQHDYENLGHDRGGILEGIGRQDYQRTAACAVPIQMMVISYNGNVLPCCHFVGDAAQHQGLVVGKIDAKTSLFDVYASKQYLAWRKDLFSIGAKGRECRNCVDYADSAVMQNQRCIAVAANTASRRIAVIERTDPDRSVEGVFRTT